MSILVLDYQKGYIDKKGKKHYLKSLIKCDKCSKESILDKRKVMKKNVHLCRNCKGKSNKGPEQKYFKQDYHDLAKTKNILWIGTTLPRNIGINTKWKCLSCGYEYNSNFSNVRKFLGCRQCVGNKKDITLDYYNKIETRFNIKRISEIPTNSHSKIQWKCDKGHILNYSYQELNLLLFSPTCKICFPFIERSMYETYYTTWSKKIKDKYKRCQKCGSYSQLEAHHIKNRRDNPELILNEDNGACLCNICHDKFHRIFGRRNTNLEQLVQFIK
jgi:ribosomal protein S27AE